MRLLIVEDDDILRDGLIRSLRQVGYQVTATASGQQALQLVQSEDPDIVILDLGLPDLPGLSVLQQIRARGNKVPVLILTALDALEDRINGLNAGADDYLGKPFDLMELEARLRALLRRSAGTGSDFIQFGPLKFDVVNKRAYINDSLLELSSREMHLLEVLMVDAGQVVSKEHLVEQLASHDQSLGVNAIEVYVHRLRKKLEPLSVNVRTFRGLGYLLETL